MKDRRSPPAGAWLWLLSAVLCIASNNNMLVSAQGVADVRLVHLSIALEEEVSGATVMLSINGNEVVGGIAYQQASKYVAVAVGRFAVSVSPNVVCPTTTFTAGLAYSVVVYGNLRCSVLSDDLTSNVGMDRAHFRLVNMLITDSITFLMRSTDCHECAFQVAASDVPPRGTAEVNLLINFPLELRFSNPDGGDYPNDTMRVHASEHGVYSVYIFDNSPKTSAIIFEDVEPNNPYIALAVAFAIAIAVTLFAFAIPRVIKQWSVSRSVVNSVPFFASSSYDYEKLINTDLGVPDDTSASRPLGGEQEEENDGRLRSLDTFRGFSLAIMIFVNYGGGGYYFFQHSTWNGLTVADLVFPWFLFMMGCSMAISFESIHRRGTSTRKLILKILQRSATLFALGLFLNNGHDLGYWRIPGVLQRFGVSYMFVSLIVLFVPMVDTRFGPFQDITAHVLHWLVILILIAVHVIVTFLLDVPGCGRGYLGAGGLDMGGAYEECTGGAAGYIDRVVLGRDHIYATPTCMTTYQTTVPFDPEGILGCLTSIALTYLGYQAGRVIVIYSSHGQRLVRWLVWGVVTGAIGTLLCFGEKDGGPIPINKNLWSVSFILVMAGTGFCFLSLFYFVIDMRRWWIGSPWRFPGMNSIVVYCGSEVFPELFSV
eukprot:Opistho-2@180